LGSGKDTTRLFGRWAYAGLGGNFGEVRLGRQWAAGFELAANIVDPFGTNFGSAGMHSTFSSANGLRVDNVIAYRSPVVNGFFGVVGYSPQASGTEVAGTSKNFHATTVGLGYMNGPLALIGTYETANNPAAGAPSAKQWWVGGTYDFKVVKVHAAYGKDKDQLGVASSVVAGVQPLNFSSSKDSDQYMIGATVPLGGGNVLASFQNRNDKSVNNEDGRVESIGYTYPLSARTNLYGVFDNVDYRNGRSAYQGKDKKEFMVGMRHLF
jgi:predicted porin